VEAAVAAVDTEEAVTEVDMVAVVTDEAATEAADVADMVTVVVAADTMEEEADS
jgi:hypothetical protein